MLHRQLHSVHGRAATVGIVDPVVDRNSLLARIGARGRAGMGAADRLNISKRVMMRP